MATYLVNELNFDQIKMQYGSDLIIDILKQHDIEYIAFNPGASFRGLHDSIVNYADNQPTLLMCCHEEISVAIAHGYAKASGKYMAVFIHANIGLQHACMAIFNAWCDRVPILLIGGVGPMDAVKRRPWIEWIHTSNHHDNIIRDYVKWCDQPFSLASTPEAIHRACRLIDTHPKAPAYIAIDCCIQEEEITEPMVLDNVHKFSPPIPPYPNLEKLSEIAVAISNATLPLIIVDFYGQSQRAVEALIQLVDLIKIPILDCGGRYNFPTDHPCNLTGMNEDFLDKVDYILCLDVRDIWGALGKLTPTGYQSYIKAMTPVVHITLGDYLVSKWVADYQKLYPVEMTISADTESAIGELYRQCQSSIPLHNHSLSERAEWLESIHQKWRFKWKQDAFASNTKTPLATASVIYEIGEAIKEEDWVLTNGGSLEMDRWAKQLWRFNKYGSYLGGSGGAGLGYGLGASIGAALVHKGTDKICIDLQADGDFLFTPGALWTAVYYEIPLLIIVMNNRSYNNSKEHAVKIANHRHRDSTKSTVGTDFSGTPIKYADMAKSFGMHALAEIHSLEEIYISTKKAIDYIKEEKKPVLLDIIIK